MVVKQPPRPLTPTMLILLEKYDRADYRLPALHTEVRVCDNLHQRGLMDVFKIPTVPLAEVPPNRRPTFKLAYRTNTVGREAWQRANSEYERQDGLVNKFRF